MSCLTESLSLPGDGGNDRRAAEAGLLVRVSRTHKREGQRGAENFLCVHRHEQAAGYGAELRPALLETDSCAQAKSLKTPDRQNGLWWCSCRTEAC